MRRVHFLLVFVLALYLAGKYGPRLHEALTEQAAGAQAQDYPIGTHYAPAENLERLDMQALRSARRKVDVCMYAFSLM